jgi:WD40 repeat protein
VAVSPDGQLVAAGSSDGSAGVWEIASGKQRFAMLGHSAAVSNIEFGPEGRYVLTGSEDGSVRVWELDE